MSSNSRPIIVIGVNPTVYLRKIMTLLSESGHPPKAVFLGSRAARLRFKYESLRRIKKQLGIIEVIYRLKRARFLGRGQHQTRVSTIATIIKKFNIEISHFDNINEGRLLFRLFEYSDPIVILAGTGLVDHAFLHAVGGVCINGHPALLPGTRGVDVIYWDIKDNMQLGVTAHEVSIKVDAGNIRKKMFIEPRVGEDIGQFVSRVEMTQAKAVVEATVEEINGAAKVEANNVTESRLKFAAPNAVFRAALAKFPFLTEK